MIRSTLRRFLELGLLVAAIGGAFVVIYLGVNQLRDDGKPVKGDEGRAQAAPVGIEATRSSWVEGQASLASYDEYEPIGERAAGVAAFFAKAREQLLKAIEAARRAAERAERRKALREYRRAKRAAERAYERALARAERARKRAERKQRRAERRRQRQLERLREKYKVPPGKECTVPEIAEQFDCETGYPF